MAKRFTDGPLNLDTEADELNDKNFSVQDDTALLIDQINYGGQSDPALGGGFFNNCQACDLMDEDNKESARFASGNGSDYRKEGDSEQKRMKYRECRYGNAYETYEQKYSDDSNRKLYYLSSNCESDDFSVDAQSLGRRASDN